MAHADEMATYSSWKNWSADQFAHCSHGSARYYAWHLRRCHPAPIARAFEIGFGNGQFMGYARSRGIEISGSEIQPALRERAAAAGFTACASIDELAADLRFDLIVAFDVFEHLPQDSLIALFRTLAARLHSGGTLLCRVPNGESPFGRIFQHGDLTHLSTLGLSKFEQISAASGLRVHCVGEVPWHVHARNPKRVLRTALRWLIERIVAFAYRQNPQTLAPNLVVAFTKLDT